VSILPLEAAALPVAEALPALLDALAAGRNAVLVAPPGAGKTTVVPLALLGAPWRGDGKMLVLEPRRLAARAAARRMAALLGEGVGGRVGFSTRLERAVGAATRIEVVTEGLLVRRLQSDPGLEGVAAVVFDEVHERSLDADLALALCRDLQAGLRPELRLLAMSATLDGAAFSRLLGDAPVIESAGRMFPVRIEHAIADLAHPRDLAEAAAKAARRALSLAEGDVLVFLPGMAEIRRTEEALAGVAAVVRPLHGDLDPAAQDLALRPDAEGRRRIILATSIAETSLTVEGVGAVVDGGFRRAPRFDAGTGLTALVTRRISRAAAAQRAGRAGRLGPGLALRLWTEAAQRGLAAQETPEILEADLAPLALDLAAWGAEAASLAFLDAPPPGALAAARALLASLGALDGAGAITARGRAMARLAAHPRLAAMMVSAGADAGLAADLAAVLEERDPLRAEGRAEGREAPVDVRLRLGRLGGAAARAAAQHRRRLGVARGAEAGLPGSGHGGAGRLLATAYPDRVAMARQNDPGAYLLSGGRGARLAVSDPLARETFLAVAALDLSGREARIRLAAPLPRAEIDALFAAAIETATEVAWDDRAGAVRARRRVRLGALVLEETAVTEVAEDAVAAALCAGIAARGLGVLPWTDAARRLQARVALMRGAGAAAGAGVFWPDLSDDALAATLQDWLAPHLAGRRALADLAGLDLAGLLRARLGHLAALLEAAFPSHVTLGNGQRAAVDYTRDPPVVSARAQAFYGLSATPRIGNGTLPLAVELLSPAGRPIAITRDLGAFWKGGWAEVRKDMRGRYPRHAWPEDPSLTAP
jgi:ATP-dependent helicase HrpB